MKEIKYNMNNIQGTDIDIDTSLFDYGFAWIESDCGTEFRFYYGINSSDGIGFDRFDWGTCFANIDVYDEFSWIDAEDWQSIYSYVGLDKQSFDNDSLPWKIYNIMGYYGYENVFGSTYHEGFVWNANIKRFMSFYKINRNK
jgi:hypothetical protein